MGIKVINHPEFVENYPYYDLFDDFSDGSVSRVSKYLTRYQTEAPNTLQGDRAYQNRLSRLYNVNRCKPYLILHRGHLAQNIAIEGLKGQRFEEILADVTRYRVNAQTMARRMLWNYMKNGRLGVLVDRQRSTSQSALGAREAGERSYQVLYSAQDIRYWSFHESGPQMGELKELVLMDKPRIDGDKVYPRLRRFELPAGAANYRWMILEAKPEKGLGTSNAAADYDFVDGDFGGIDVIPFYLWGCGREDSFLVDIAELNKADMNIGSVESNINHHQGFQRSYAVGATAAEIEKTGEQIISVIEDPNAKLFTISAGDPSAIQSERARIINEINRRGKFEFNQLADDTRQVQSAESKSKDMQARKGIYDNVTDELQDALKFIYGLHAKFEEEPADKLSVTVSRDYGLEDETAVTQEETLTFNQARELGATEVQRAILRTRVARLRLKPKPNEDEKKMAEELAADIEASAAEGSNLASSNRPPLGALFQ